MKNSQRVSRQQFLYPYSPYHGDMTPKNMIFNANLQEFSQRIGFISSLYTGGKLSSEEAYDQIEMLWQQLKHTKQTIFDPGSPSKSD